MKNEFFTRKFVPAAHTAKSLSFSPSGIRRLWKGMAINMLEIPESLTIAGQLNETIQGKRILEVEAAHTPHSFAWYSGEPGFYAEIMEGREIGVSVGIGSMVEISLGSKRQRTENPGAENHWEYIFLMGDGATIRYFEPGEPLPERYQTRITLEDDSSVVCSIRMYGTMLLVRPELFDNPYYLAAKRKPLPNTEDFTYSYFKGLFDEVTGNLSMKAFLAAEQRIPGLGNGVLQDILLEAGVHPKRKIGSLTEAQRRRVYDAVQETLRKMTAGGGRDTEKDLFGRKGRYHTMLCQRAAGKPCPYCGTEIRKANYLGGTIYFCPMCQEM